MKTILVAVIIFLLNSSLSAGAVKEPACFTPDTVETIGPYKAIISREYQTSWERSLILKAENILPNVDSLEQLSEDNQTIARYNKILVEKEKGKAQISSIRQKSIIIKSIKLIFRMFTLLPCTWNMISTVGHRINLDSNRETK
jgi:hypothetical protein